MPYIDYRSPHAIEKSGQCAYLRGIEQSGNPISRRTDANGAEHWNNGWLKQSRIGCRGIELGDGEYTGCTQTGGDCPVCGL